MGRPDFKISGRKPIHGMPSGNTKKINEEKEKYAAEDEIDEDEIEEEEMEDFEESLGKTTETIFEKEIDISGKEIIHSKQIENQIHIRNRSTSPTHLRNRSVSPHSLKNNAKFYKRLHKEIPTTPYQSNRIEIASKRTYLIIASIIVIISMVAWFVVAENGYDIYLSDKRSRTSHIEKKTCQLKKIEKMYPLEEKMMWETLKYDIEEITNNKNAEGPSVYLFLQNEYSEARFILTDIAELAASCYDSHSKPIILTSEDFDSNDYGIAIEKYKNRIHDGGVVVVLVHLNELPGKAARALHAICDKHSPIVKNAIIFLSLRIDDNSKGRPIDIAENTLRNLWKPSLKNNELDPLIVRISDSVFRLQS